MRNNIRKAYLWNTLGVFAQNAISPLLLVVITRINGIYVSGLFSYAFAVSLICWAFGMWGGRTYQVSDVINEFSHRSYIMLRFILAIFMVLGSLAFSFVNHYDTTKTSIILALVLFKAAESVADSLHAILQIHDRLYLVGKSLLYKAIGGFGSFLVIDLLLKNVLLGCVAIFTVNVLLLLFYDLRIARQLEPLHVNTTQIRHLAEEVFMIMKRCAPVFAVIFLAMFSLNIPRYFIDRYREGQIGYFGVLAMPITLIALMMMFVLQPNVVGLSRLYEKSNYLAFNRIVKKLMSVTCLIGFGVLFVTTWVGVPVLNLIFGVNFAPYKTALIITVAGGIVNALVSIFINILIIVRHFRGQFLVLLLTNIALAALSATTVHKYGLKGGVTLFAGINLVQIILLVFIYIKLIYRRVKHV